MDGGVLKPTIYLVTEPVMPLAEKIKELDLQGTQRYTVIPNPMKNAPERAAMYVIRARGMED